MHYALKSSSACLIACLILTSCVSQRSEPTVTTPGYDLRIAGDEVLLSFHRELTVPEFLEVAQHVTGAVYVFHQDDVESAGPVSMDGRMQCKRSEFPSFVTKVLHTRGLRAEAKTDSRLDYVEISSATKPPRS